MYVHPLRTIYYLLYAILFFIDSLYCNGLNNQTTKQPNNHVRIVSLTPSITESLYILGKGENVVGITTFCRRISKTQKIIGTYLEPNMEEIVKLAADFVFISKEGTRKEVVDELKKFGIKVVVFEPINSFLDVKNQLIEIANILNKKDVAIKIIKEYESKIQRIKPSTYKKVLCVISLQPIIVASNNSYIGEIIKYAGGENVIYTSQLKYPQISIEELIRLNPEVIILPDMGMNEKGIKNFFLQYKTISAVKNNQVYILPSDILCQPNIKNFYISVEKINKILNK